MSHHFNEVHSTNEKSRQILVKVSICGNPHHRLCTATHTIANSDQQRERRVHAKTNKLVLEIMDLK